MTFTRLRAASNLLFLATPLGLLIARIGGAQFRLGPRHLVIAEGYKLPLPNAAAFTVGNVLIFRERLADVEGCFPDIVAHEERHSSQWACLGPLFLPAYGIASLYSWLRTKDRAAGNWFEKDAGLAEGGYCATD